MLPTILEAAQVQFRADDSEREVPEFEGCSLLPALRGGKPKYHTLFWEHTGNAALRRGRWKLVREYPSPWELYDMETDRSEKIDLASTHPDRVCELVAAWSAWAGRVGVVPWDNVLASYRAAGKSEAEAAG
jgi:arylsulfatase